jgi:hypothetical protein
MVRILTSIKLMTAEAISTYSILCLLEQTKSNIDKKHKPGTIYKSATLRLVGFKISNSSFEKIKLIPFRLGIPYQS